MSTPKFGQISLNGNRYRISMGNGAYRGRDVIDFAPRASTPGGVTYSQLGLYQALTQTDFRHGFGFYWNTDPMGYASTDGNIDTRHAGIAMMMTGPTKVNSVSAGSGSLFLAVNSYRWLFAVGVSGNLYYYDGAAFQALSPNNVLSMWSNGKYVFVSTSNARIQKALLTDLTTWTDAGVNANSAYYTWIVPHDGFVYAGKRDTNQVYYASTDDLSDLHGAPEDDPAMIKVGPPGWSTMGAVSYNGNLLVFKYDGLYQLDKASLSAKKLLDYTDLACASTFSGWGVFNGTLYYAIGDRIYSWNGVRATDVTPPRLNDTYPYVSYGNFRFFKQMGPYLILVARTNDTNYCDDLLAYDGVGWHKLARLSNGGGYPIARINVMDYEWQAHRIWYNVFGSDGTQGTYYIPCQTFSDYPYPSFPTSGNHYLYTSRIDAGYRLIKKSTNQILIEANNLSANHYYLKIHYSLDEGAWVPWGQNDGATNVITTNGITILSNPLNTIDGKSTLEYYQIRFRIQFVTDNVAQSPILSSITTKLVMRPELAYGWSLNIIAENSLESAVGRTERRTGKGIINDLRTARNSKAPITYIDPYGDTYKVYITSINEMAQEEVVGREGSVPDINQMIQLNLVQVQ